MLNKLYNDDKTTGGGVEVPCSSCTSSLKIRNKEVVIQLCSWAQNPTTTCTLHGKGKMKQ